VTIHILKDTSLAVFSNGSRTLFAYPKEKVTLMASSGSVASSCNDALAVALSDEPPSFNRTEKESKSLESTPGTTTLNNKITSDVALFNISQASSSL